MEQTAQDYVLTDIRGGMGVIALNRPRAVNAINAQMLVAIDVALDRFERDSAVSSVLIAGTGERGLCAGGDVVYLYKNMRENPEDCIEYFRDEYRLNYRLAKYPKPIISLMDGLVLGGGMGVSAYGSHRIVTERSSLGMPESVIGFSPDVGMAKMLSKAPRQLGTLMALTGIYVNASDALICGLADYYVPYASIGELMSVLENADDAQSIDLVLRRFVGEPPSSSPLAENASWINQVFSRSSVEDIVDGVREQVAVGNEFAAQVLKALEHNSPTGMKVGLQAIRRAKTQELHETLNQDFRLVTNAMQAHDMREGIRAQVIDKDRQPQWSPATLAEVSADYVDSFFAPVEAGSLNIR